MTMTAARSMPAPETLAQAVLPAARPYQLCVVDAERALLGRSDARLCLMQSGSAREQTPNPGCVTVPLARLPGGDQRCLLWASESAVDHGQAAGFSFADNGALGVFHMTIEEAQLGDLPQAIEACYRELFAKSDSRGYPQLLRVWNYLSDINQGSGDAERYRQFCLGRARAISQFSPFDSSLPAATAIGGPAGSGFTLIALVGREPGLQIENPQQLSAYLYPRAYGPQSPSFSRATLLNWADGADLLVSGTASILGHASVHVGDVAAQARQTHANLASLIRQAARQLARAVDDFTPRLYTAYLRDPADLAQLQPVLHECFADAPLQILHGDICRAELLVEVEAIYELAPSP